MTTEATTKTLDQIQAPEELKRMVDPTSERQVNTLDRFLSDMGVSDGPPEPADEEEGGETNAGADAAAEQSPPKKLAGKFDSAEELERAYQALEQKLGQPKAEPAQTVEAYTTERGVEVYGETVAAAIEAAEINPFEMAAKVQAGEDVAAFVDALVEKGKLPRPIVEAYLQGVRPAAPPAADAAGSINDNPAAVAALRQSVGGDAAFDELSRWAATNLSAEEKAEYQQAVDTGNVGAVQWALRSFQVRQQAGQSKREPAFLGGGSQATEPLDVYESRSDWQKDRYAADGNGRELYAMDESYRDRVDAKHQRSKRAGRW
jgi:hypothetical protein